MPSSPDYLRFVLDQCADVEGVASRSMMGEYLLYVRGRLIGGIYDDRLLVKPTSVARSLLPDVPAETPYPGAKPMLLVENVDDREFLSALFRALYEAAPESRKQQNKGGKRNAEQQTP